jgi:hypothetical protein
MQMAVLDGLTDGDHAQPLDTLQLNPVTQLRWLEMLLMQNGCPRKSSWYIVSK